MFQLLKIRLSRRGPRRTRPSAPEAGDPAVDVRLDRVLDEVRGA